MKNFLIAFVIFLLWSIAGIWFYSCYIKGICITIPKVEKVQESTVTKSQSDSILPEQSEPEKTVELDENLQKLFRIQNGTANVTPIESSFDYKNSVYDYLNQHQKEELIITSYYNDTESDSLGAFRGMAVKNILVSYGINGDKISLKSVSKSFVFDENNFYDDGIQLHYETLSDRRLEEIERGIANKTLYSSFASEDFKPDNTLAAYALELKGYLEKYPDKQVVITGHTDNVGEEIDNEWIGMERAKNVRRYLISQGIKGDEIQALSKGELNPVADNATKEGRQKNRRIEIIVN